MRYFEKFFKDTDFTQSDARGEVKVLCPFHNDTTPSASVNVENSLFKCWAGCGGHNEAEFASRIEGIPTKDAVRLLADMDASNVTFDDWAVNQYAMLWSDVDFVEYVSEKLQVSWDVIEDLKLGKSFVDEVPFLSIPIFVNGILMNEQRYNITGNKHYSKIMADKRKKAGWLIPFDKFQEDNLVYILEGEKDMIVARGQGLNSFNLTGGANTLPNDTMLPYFEGKDVVIVYDNDDAGRLGGIKLGNHLVKLANSVKVVDMSQLVPAKKGDFADYIHDDWGDMDKFNEVVKNTPLFDEQEIEVEYRRIDQQLSQSAINVPFTAKVTVTADVSAAYSVPALVEFTKERVDDNDSTATMAEGEKRYWTLEDWKLQSMLPLIEIDAKAANVAKMLKSYAGVPEKEKKIKRKDLEQRTVYKALITDAENKGIATSLEVYTFEQMDIGSNYEAELALHAHPTKNQKVVGIVKSLKKIGDSDNFKANKELLAKYKGDESDFGVDYNLERLFQSARQYVAPHMDFNIWLMTELVFHSILEFDYGGVMRGALDVFLLGDTQVGKSETTSKLTELYEAGHFLSLKTSTEVGLIGGSDTVDGTFVNKIGAIPRQHGKLVILEEFSGAPHGFIKKMTDIRSSGVVRITRAAGELQAPCKVRMLTISNPINDVNGNARTLNMFPNGTIPLQELITSAEDMTRYDGFLLCPKPDKIYNPFDNENVNTFGDPIEKEAYVHKMEWVFSRGVDDVVFEKGVQSYIWEQASQLNEKFESNVNIFGTTTSKKLARFCVALASLLTNTDEEFKKVIVTEEIVDYIVNWLDTIYSSKQFRLDTVRNEWKRHTVHTKQELEIMQQLYYQNATLFNYIASISDDSRYNILTVSGLDNKTFSKVFNSLVSMRAIRVSKNSVYPTEKFRNMYEKIDKDAIIEEVQTKALSDKDVVIKI